VADDYLPLITDDHFTYLKNAHKLSITCVAVAPNGRFLFSGGKEGRLVKWSFPDGKKLHTIKEGHRDKQEDYEGHTFSISAIAISTDCKYLASSDTSPHGVFLLWNPDNISLLHRFHGHRAAVTGLAFRKATHTLYSSSNDRSIKVWDVADTAYVETLFGHSEAITSLDSLFRERAVSSGGRDSTVRLWKIPEESQLVFQGTTGQSIDIVKFLDEQHFVSAGEDG
jgi:ribosomal RNA-processing protein 9